MCRDPDGRKAGQSWAAWACSAVYVKSPPCCNRYHVFVLKTVFRLRTAPQRPFTCPVLVTPSVLMATKTVVRSGVGVNRSWFCIRRKQHFVSFQINDGNLPPGHRALDCREISCCPQKHNLQALFPGCSQRVMMRKIFRKSIKSQIAKSKRTEPPISVKILVSQ